MIQPEESLEEYGGGGGYASGLSLQGDGVGLRLTEVAGGTGSTDITRVTLQDGSLVREKQWSGRMDAVPQELSFTDIPWHDITDTSALDRWTSEAGISQQGGSSSSAGGGTESGAPHRWRPHRLYRHGRYLQLRRSHCSPGLPRSQRPLVRLQPDLPSHCAGYPPGDGTAIGGSGGFSKKGYRACDLGLPMPRDWNNMTDSI